MTLCVSAALAAPVDTGRQLWLDGADPSTIVYDGFGQVEQWNDKSGNNFHATQPDVNKRPIYAVGALGGQNAIRFDGVNDGMLIHDGLNLGTFGGNYTVFIVDQYYGAVQNRTLQGADTNWLLGKWGGLNAHFAEGWVSDPAGGSIGPPANPAAPNYAGINRPVISEGDRNTTGPFSQYTANGVNRSIDGNPTGSPGRLRLVGEGAFPNEVSQADVAELQVWDRWLSPYESAVVGTALGQKYNIATTYSLHNATKMNVFTGADPGEGLDFQGNFVHAVNARGPGGFSVGNANFTDDTGIIVAENEILGWVPGINLGGSADDNNLETVMQSIRWSSPNGAGIEDIQINLPGLVPGRVYKLQTLFADRGNVRHWQVQAEGNILSRDLHEAAVMGNNSGSDSPNRGVVMTHTFVARDNTYNLVFNGAAVGGGDTNPIINGLTIEDLGPATFSTTVGTFTGGDPGEGLDMQGAFLYAVNARGPGGFAIGDAFFTDSNDGGVSVAAQNEILNWTSPNFGPSANDQNLNTVMGSIRWTDTTHDGDGIFIDLDNLAVGAQYKLQLMFLEGCCDRGFDIMAEGVLIVDEFNPSRLGAVIGNGLGAVVTYEFIATDTQLNIVLDGYAAGFIDPNPILNGFTLEFVVPEPSSIALLAVGASVGLAGYVRRLRKDRGKA